MKESFIRCVPFFACLLVSCVTARYQTYDVEGMCVKGSLKVSLESSGELSAGILKATDKISYSINMQCKILLEAPTNHFIMVSIRQIGFRTELLGKCIDYIQIENERVCEPIYSEDEERHYPSSNNKMNLIYHTEGMNNKTLSGYPGFTITFTAFQKDDGRSGPCSHNTTDLFSCDKNICIWSGLTCDGHNNCGDLSDEDPYGHSNCGRTGRGSSVLIVLGVVIVFLLIIMCAATLLCTKNETVRRFSTRLRSRTVSFIPRPSPRRTSFKQLEQT
nr:uncharacterized protein LOC110283034 [Parasteatoda tepidariorum]